jgi:iron complex outermembrane receptor protein
LLSGNNNGFYWLARGSHKQAQDYKNRIDGRVYGTNYAETDANASVGLTRSWGYSRFDATLFDNLLAVPDGSRDSASRLFTKQITEIDTFRPIASSHDLNTYDIPVLHQRIQHYRAVSSSSFNIGKSRLSLILGYERSIRREFNHPENAAIPGLYLKLNTGTYDVKFFFPEYKGWDVTVGINGMYQTNDANQGTDFLIPSYRQFDFGPFAVAKKTMGKLDVSGGIRFDSRNFHNDALFSGTNPSTGFGMYVPESDTVGATQVFYKSDHAFSGISGSVGATYNFSNQVSMKANIARGFRAPNIFEISANGVHPGTNIYQIGNPNFLPEFSLQEDIGLDFASHHLSVSGAVFNNVISNYIYNQKVLDHAGADSVIVQGTRTFQFQASKAQLFGGELDIDLHPHPLDWLHFENIVSVVYAVNKGNGSGVVADSEKYLPFIPPLHGITELRGDFKRLGRRLKNAFFKAQLEYYMTQDRVYWAFNTETPTPGYGLFNLALGADVTSRAGRTLFSLSLFANNILDAAYQNHLSRLKYFEPYPTDPRGHHGIYNTGRNIGLRLNVPFSIR